MILGYRDARTERFARGERVKQFEPFRRKAEMVLDRLGAAAGLADVANFPGHRLEKLKGDRKGHWSVRVNDQWRICFRWDEGAAGPAEERVFVHGLSQGLHLLDADLESRPEGGDLGDGIGGDGRGVGDGRQPGRQRRAGHYTRGLRARMNALMNLPSIVGATASTSSPAPVRNLRASSAR